MTPSVASIKVELAVQWSNLNKAAQDRNKPQYFNAYTRIVELEDALHKINDEGQRIASAMKEILEPYE